VGSSLQSRISQRLVADNSNGRSHVRRDGLHDAVRSFRSQAGLPVQPVGDGRRRSYHGVRAQLLRLPRASLLHRSASTGSLQTGHFTRDVPFVWLNGSVVNALGIRARGPGFDSPVVPLFHQVAIWGKLFTHIVSPVSQLHETGVQKGTFRRLSGYGD